METKEFKIQGNQLTVTIPDGMILDEENSTFECIKFKPITKSKFSDYDGTRNIVGFFVGSDSDITEIKEHHNFKNYKSTRGCFATEKQAKSALAMAQISQIMANDERFGGIITDEEWNDVTMTKRCIIRCGKRLIADDSNLNYQFLAFHTEEQRELFIEENEDLVMDYLMMEIELTPTHNLYNFFIFTKNMDINVIYPEDCLKGLSKLPNECVDLIFTDPPYYQNRAGNLKGLKHHKDLVTEFKFDGFESEEDYLSFMEKVIIELFRVSKDGASGYLWCGDDYVSYLNRIIEKAGFKFRKVIHWHKTNPFPAISTRKMFSNSMEIMIHFSKGSPKTWNAKDVNRMHNFIEAPICMGKERTGHETQKPLKVCYPFIEISSNPNDLILDPFMGSGTTALAALYRDRNFIGFEIEDKYCDIIEKRLENFMIDHALFLSENKPRLIKMDNIK